MCKIASDENFSKKLSEESIKIRKKYSIENIYEMWMNLLEE